MLIRDDYVTGDVALLALHDRLVTGWVRTGQHHLVIGVVDDRVFLFDNNGHGWLDLELVKQVG